jgi:thiol-disulfide isomerase/thioredoxin/tetratricopeptide (TPR) repeat protein
MKTLFRVLILAAALPLAAQVTTEAEAVARLRGLYSQLDDRQIVREGRDLIHRFPTSTELRAFYIAGLSAVDPAEGLRMAKQVRYAHPNDPWGWYALTIAQFWSIDEDHLAAATGRAMLAMYKGTDPEFPKLYAKVLLLRGLTHDLEKFVAGRTETWAKSAQAQLLDIRSWKENELVDPAQAALAEAEKNDPTNASLVESHATGLARRRRTAEALPLYKRAVELAPDSLGVRFSYWKALGKENQAIAAADIEQYVKRRPYPEVLGPARASYRAIGLPEKAEEMRRRILAEFPDSVQAETILYSEAQDYGREIRGKETPEQRAEISRRWRVFLDYPYHEGKNWLAGAYQLLLRNVQESGTDEEVLQAVDGWLAYDEPSRTYTVAEILARRGLRLDEAERIARNAHREVAKKLERDKDFYAAQEYANAKDIIKGYTSTNLGAVLLKRNKLEEAGKHLKQAVKLVPKFPAAYLHLGKWYEATKQLTKADETYAQGMTHERAEDARNAQALHDLYVKRHGSEEGWPSYVAAAKEGTASKMKRVALASRIVPARPVKKPFSLKTLDGTTVSLASLSGKAVIVKFWGVWCGPCVAEMPDFQKVVDKYASDPNVAIVTIDSDQDPETPREFMKKFKYNFPVLLDDGWISRATGINSYPTTWFIDAGGKIAFEKKGMSPDMLNEYSWRIEALKTR